MPCSNSYPKLWKTCPSALAPCITFLCSPTSLQTGPPFPAKAFTWQKLSQPHRSSSLISFLISSALGAGWVRAILPKRATNLKRRRPARYPSHGGPLCSIPMSQSTAYPTGIICGQNSAPLKTTRPKILRLKTARLIGSRLCAPI